MLDHGITPGTVALALGKPGLHVDQAVISRVVDTVRDLCGWHVFPPREETIKVPTTGDKMVLLPTLKVRDVKNVTWDGEPLEGWDWSEDGIIRLPRRLPEAFRRLEVTFTHGFELPKSMLGVIASMVSRADAFTGAQTVGNITIGATQTVTPQSREWRIIDRYALGPLP